MSRCDLCSAFRRILQAHLPDLQGKEEQETRRKLGKARNGMCSAVTPCAAVLKRVFVSGANKYPPPPLRKHRLVLAPGPGLTVTFTEFLTTAFMVRK